MNDIFFKITPVIFILLLGYVLKRLNILKNADGDLFLKLAFYTALPALIVLSLAKVNLRADFIYLPIAAALIIFSISGIAYLFGRWFGLPRPSLGAFVVGSTIMNIGFALPFVFATYGEEGLARISLFDFGNGLLTFTFVYYLACRFGQNSGNQQTMAKKILTSPPIWALLIGIIINLSGIPLPRLASSFLQPLAGLAIPLIMLALGIYFKPKLLNSPPVFAAALVRMIGGMTVGFIIVRLFGLSNLNASIVLIASAAPIGYNTLTFSSLENLDKELAANLVSFSIMLGIFTLPILIVLLS